MNLSAITRKATAMFLAVLLFLGTLPADILKVRAETINTSTNGFHTYTYTVENDKATIIGCDIGSASYITVPDTLGWYPVTAIGERAFENCCFLRGITLPDSVTTIGNSAFSGCDSLENITIPDSVTTIGDYAFYDCSVLKSVTLPNGVTTIGDSAFACGSLKVVYYSGTEADRAAITIGTGNYGLIDAAWHCGFAELGESNNYVYVVSPEGTATITEEYNIFGDVIVPDTIGGYPVTAIGGKAFLNCDSLKSITFPAGVMTIGDSAFYGCDSLGSITLPDSVTIIGKQAFLNCDSLASVTLPDSLMTIGDSAFYSCSSLEGIAIPDGVTAIGDSVFSYCKSLASITISGSVTTIGEQAFYECGSLKSIVVDEANPAYYSKGNCLIETATNTLVQGCYTSVIPDSVKTIGDSAFHNCDSLTGITIPVGVTTIGSYAFHNCDSLTGITIPVGVTTIGNSAFYGCDSLEAVYYSGTESDRAAIAIVGYDNSDLTNAEWHYGVKEVGKIDGVTYAVSAQGEATVIGCDTTVSGDVIVHDTFAGYPVTAIGNGAFYNCDSLKSITLSAGVATIGDSAFYDCDSLTGITLPAGVTTIGGSAFYDCDSLTGITLPAGVTTIGNRAFLNCDSLKSITLSAGVATIGDSAFYDCDSLTGITIPDGVTTIGRYTFFGCSSLKSITLPDGVTTIGDYAFSQSGLTSITLPDGVTTIGNYAFSQSGLTSITLPDGVTTIGDRAFYNCGSLKSIMLPDGLTTIGDHAFSGSGLTSITLPGSLTMIDDAAFSWCSSLTSVTILDGVTMIGGRTFEDCRSLTSVTLPDSVTTIGYSAFYSCRSLKGITIPDSVTTIGHTAFVYCDSLESITLPDSVTTIGERAFAGCDSLEGITIPDSVTTIGDSAFYCCLSLESITFPDSVTTIGDSAFAGCDSLEGITLPDSVTSIADDAFRFCRSLASIVVDEANPVYHSKGNCLIETATNTLIQGCYTSVIPDSVTTIGDSAFKHCESLEGITIPDSVTTIGGSAFYDCDSLEGITLSDGVTTIGGSAFYDCDSLTSITLPDGVTTIGGSAFYDCDSLTSITLPATVTSIGENAFSGCEENLTTVYYNGTAKQWRAVSIASGNTVLDTVRIVTATAVINGPISPSDFSYTVYDGTATITAYKGKAEQVTVPSELGGYPVTAIGAEAFANNTAIASVVIPKGITQIGSRAFYGCTELASITLPDGITDLFCTAFDNTAYDNEPSHWENGVLYIGQYLCQAADTLGGSYTVRDGTKYIAREAFYGCRSLEKVTLPADIVAVGEDAFRDCDLLYAIDYLGDSYRWEILSKDIYRCCLTSETEQLGGFSVTFLPNGGSYAPAPQQKLKDTPLVLTKQLAERDGYVCIGWSVTPSGDIVFKPGDTYDLPKPLTLYAVWVHACNITYYSEFSTEVSSAERLPIGAQILFPVATQSGYRFMGWSTVRGGNIVYGKGDTPVANSDMTLYAVYRALCTVCDGDHKVYDDCNKCFGRGYLYESRTCTYCNNGKVTSSCTSCGGDGSVSRPVTATCAICKGAGTYYSDSFGGWILCTGCDGTGQFTYDQTSSCSTCAGTGRIQGDCYFCGGDGECRDKVTCYRCDGDGRMNERSCTACDDDGTVGEYAYAGGAAFDYDHTVGNLKGDMTGDGYLNMMDVLNVYHGLSGKVELTASQKETADFNDDGIFNMMDVLAIYNKISGH